SWSGAQQFCIDLGISGLQSGLTLMQFANNLALLRLCHPPTLDEMTEVLALRDHQTKGAVQGLILMGLLPNAWTPDLAEIADALERLGNHLGCWLHAPNQDLISFSEFRYFHIENFLCKVLRWYNHL
ncbi:hypothetical protein C8J56DRAFT_746986, partial [Mycena floridula]